MSEWFSQFVAYLFVRRICFLNRVTKINCRPATCEECPNMQTSLNSPYDYGELQLRGQISDLKIAKSVHSDLSARIDASESSIFSTRWVDEEIGR